VPDELEVGLREQEPGERGVLARGDHHEVRLREPDLPQDGLMAGIAALNLGGDDELLAPQPVGRALEQPAACGRVHPREVLGLGVAGACRNARWDGIEELEAGARPVRQRASSTDRGARLHGRIGDCNENPFDFWHGPPSQAPAADDDAL